MNSALGLFGRQGYAATSVDRIASHAGVAKGSVYWHFKDKEDLLLATIEREIDAMRSHLTELAGQAEGDPAAAVAAILDLERWSTGRTERIGRLFTGALAGAGSSAAARIEKRLMLCIRSAYREGRAATAKLLRRAGTPSNLKPDVAAICLIASLWGMLHILTIDGSHNLAQVTRAMRRIFIKGEGRNPPPAMPRRKNR